jgi:transglutaminase-like putative cysteine protease
VDKKFISPDWVVQSDNSEIIALASEIAKNCTDDNQRLVSVHDWVAKNIAYNVEGFFSGVYGDNDAVSVLKTKKAVCADYSNLFAALMRALNISTRVVSGIGLGYGYSGLGWKDVDRAKTNHAWNEVFINNRWVFVDTTWDSGAAGANKQFVPNFRRMYLDASIEFFSIDHLIVK